MDPALEVEAEVDLARLVVLAVGRPHRHQAGEEERPVEGRPQPQLAADGEVAQHGQGHAEQEPEQERVLKGGRHPYFFSVWGSGPCRPLTALLSTLSLGLVVDADLEGVVLDAHDGPEDAGVDDHLVPRLEPFTISSSFFCLVFMGRMRTK